MKRKGYLPLLFIALVIFCVVLVAFTITAWFTHNLQLFIAQAVVSVVAIAFSAYCIADFRRQNYNYVKQDQQRICFFPFLSHPSHLL